MKYTVVAAILLFPLNLFAQDPLQKKNEIGVFAESNFMDGYGGPVMSTIGVSCKHAQSELLSFTALAGRTNYSIEPQPFKRPINIDTITWSNRSTNASLFMAGAGVEAQRKFYKRIHLFAGGELRMSWGKGRCDTVIITEYKNTSPATQPAWPAYSITSFFDRRSGADMIVTQMGLVCYIGIKVVLDRFNAGYTLSNYLYRYHNQRTDNGISDTHSNFELGNTYQRLFVAYRF
jgi:hypothetical protein